MPSSKKCTYTGEPKKGRLGIDFPIGRQCRKATGRGKARRGGEERKVKKRRAKKRKASRLEKGKKARKPPTETNDKR